MYSISESTELCLLQIAPLRLSSNLNIRTLQFKLSYMYLQVIYVLFGFFISGEVNALQTLPSPCIRSDVKSSSLHSWVCSDVGELS